MASVPGRKPTLHRYNWSRDGYRSCYQQLPEAVGSNSVAISLRPVASLSPRVSPRRRDRRLPTVLACGGGFAGHELRLLRPRRVSRNLTLVTFQMVQLVCRRGDYPSLSHFWRPYRSAPVCARQMATPGRFTLGNPVGAQPDRSFARSSHPRWQPLTRHSLAPAITRIETGAVQPMTGSLAVQKGVRSCLPCTHRNLWAGTLYSMPDSRSPSGSVPAPHLGPALAPNTHAVLVFLPRGLPAQDTPDPLCHVEHAAGLVGGPADRRRA